MKDLIAEEKLMKKQEESKKFAEDAVPNNVQMNAMPTQLVQVLISMKEV